MMRNMREKGKSIKSIARELGISRNSVRKYLRSEPKGKQKRKGGSKLDPYREKIRALIDEHNLSAVRILEEIRKMGYDGGYTILKDYCHDLRKDRRILVIWIHFLQTVFQVHSSNSTCLYLPVSFSNHFFLKFSFNIADSNSSGVI